MGTKYKERMSANQMSVVRMIPIETILFIIWFFIVIKNKALDASVVFM